MRDRIRHLEFYGFDYDSTLAKNKWMFPISDVVEVVNEKYDVVVIDGWKEPADGETACECCDLTFTEKDDCGCECLSINDVGELTNLDCGCDRLTISDEG